MVAAIRVKSPFSQRALFRFVGAVGAVEIAGVVVMAWAVLFGVVGRGGAAWSVHEAAIPHSRATDREPFTNVSFALAHPKRQEGPPQFE
jgi:hypothetical protein